MSNSDAPRASSAAAWEGPRPWRSVAFDTAVVAAGVAVAAWALTSWVRHGTGDLWPLLALPLVVLLARFPLVLLRPEGDIEIGFDSAVLVVLALQSPPAEALAIWSLGTALAQGTTPKRWASRVFNFGLGTSVGGLAVALMHAIDPLNRAHPRELLAVALGCAAYFVADFVLTDVSVAIEARARILKSWHDPSVSLSFAVFVGIDTLGFVGALLVTLVPWALPLLAAPIITMLLATRAFARANKNETLMTGLFDAAFATQTMTSREELLDVLVTQVRQVLRSPKAGFRNAPPDDREIGVQLGEPTGRGTWLVVPPRLSGAPYIDEDRRTLETLAALARESLQRARLVTEMAHMARHDPLTGLPNRALFQDRVEHAVVRQQRDGNPLAVLFVDLDGFKSVNDTLGHEVGDELLVAVAERLRSCVRPADTVARLGGDEFAVLLEDMATLDGACEASGRMVAAIGAPFSVGGTQVTVGASVGIALRSAGEDADALLRNSDLAMYRAKLLGKGRFEVFEPSMLAENLERLSLEGELRDVVGNGQLRLCYQPVVNLHTGDVEGFEALLRWEHPQLGTISPLRFVGIAEETGLILPIGAWVLDRAYRDAAGWARTLGRTVSLGVNVSGRQLAGPGLVEQVRRLRREEPGDVALMFEITESMLVRNEADTADTLRALRQLGVKFAIDDFGTGYSSISYLRQLPVDALKIDRSFVSEVTGDSKAAALVEAITAMGTSLSLDLVAEGIEEVEQVALLRALGCRLGQGYWFGRPMTAAEAGPFLARGRVDVAAEVTALGRTALRAVPGSVDR